MGGSHVYFESGGPATPSLGEAGGTEEAQQREGKEMKRNREVKKRDGR